MAFKNRTGYNTLDESFTSISTPAQAEKHYLPLFLSNKYDLMAIKKELREKHNFSEEDVLISARVISSAHVKHLQRNPNNHKAFDYFNLILGIILFCSGLFLILFLWDLGWISTIPFILVGTGITMIFRSNVLGKKA